MGNRINSERPFRRVFVDFLGPYPRSKRGNVGIFVLIGHLTKYPMIKAIRRFTTTDILGFLETQAFHIFGVPEFVTSDNGPQFKYEAFANLMSKYGIEHILTVLYSPQ